MVTESKEREDAIRMMAKTGEEELSSNFLSTYGFSFLNMDGVLWALKLEEVTKGLGLRSPEHDKSCYDGYYNCS